MHFFIERQAFLNILLTVQRAVAITSSQRELKGIYLEAREGALFLRGTDVEMEIECTLPVRVLEEGEVLLPARYLVEVVRRLVPGEVEFKRNPEGHKVTLKAGRAALELYAYSSMDFPQRPNLEEAIQWEIQQETLNKMIEQTVFAAAKDNIRPAFNGVSFSIAGNTLEMVATDGHRLAFCRNLMATASPVEERTIIPRRSLEEFSRIYRDAEEAVRIKKTGGQISFSTDNTKLTSRLIEAKFFDYRQVLPEEYKTRITIDTGELLAAIERAAVLTSEKASSVHLKVTGDRIQLFANTPEIGKIEDELFTSVEGEDNSISFNPRYIIEVLRVIDSPEVFFDITGSVSPCTIRPADNKDIIHLIMPVTTRVNA
jgi:DNA polymerase-3 subunit beta